MIYIPVIDCFCSFRTMETDSNVIKERVEAIIIVHTLANNLWFSFPINLGVETQGQVGFMAIKKHGHLFYSPKPYWRLLTTQLTSNSTLQKFQAQIPLKINKLTNLANVKEREQLAASCRKPTPDFLLLQRRTLCNCSKM